LGVSPVQRQALARGDRYQILPAYTSEGVLTASIYKGATDISKFESFLEHVLLPKCGQYPAKHSVIVMDNAAFHYSARIPELCAEAGVVLIYLPPYSPDYNPIEEFFLELKAYVKKNWRLYLDTTDRSHGAFESFLGFCVSEVGQRKRSAEGHFRNAGLLC
jgi:transposase